MKLAMQRLNDLIKQKNSRICAGLDPTWDIISKEHIFYNCCIKYIQAISEIVPAIKINSAFFEKAGMEATYFEVAKEAKKKGLFVIGDLKRSDIGSTSAAYAEAYLNQDSPFDAITVNPYFGTDGVMPFIQLANQNKKGVFILVKTFNKSSKELQELKLEDGRLVYEAVADLVVDWSMQIIAENDKLECGQYNSIGAVIGATSPKQAENLKERMMNDVFRLVPEYGVQGATADDIAVNFDNDGLGAIVNSSLAIMKKPYDVETWIDEARAKAITETKEINEALAKIKM